MEKQNLIFYQFDREMPIIDTICKDLEKKGDFEITFVDDYSELGQLTAQFESMVVVFRLIENHDLAQTVGTLQATKEKYKEGLFRAICIQKKPAERKVERLLRNLGCNEFFDTNTNPRTIRFKIDFLGRGIKAAVKQKEQTARHKARGAANSQEQEKAEDQLKVHFVKPLSIDSDVWILKEEDDYKKVLGRWLFHMIGPSSRVGTWEFIESRDQDINGCWKYVIEPEFQGQFITEEGAWYFKGNRPDFDWKVSRWKFSSQDPRLFFKSKEGELEYRINLDEKYLLISKNSEAAMLKEREILETCDGRFAVNKDKKESGSEMSYMDRMAQQKEDNLRGKGNFEEEQSRLKGKNSSEDKQGSLRGSIKQDAKESQSQEDKERKGFKEESDNDLSGKGSKTEDIEGHLKGGVKKESKDAEVMRDSERKSFKEESSNDLSGKGSKTEGINGHLKGGVKKEDIAGDQNEDKSFSGDNPNSKELEIKEDQVSDGSVQGKMKKENVQKGALQGAIKNEQMEAEKNDPENKGTAENIDGHLKGGLKKEDKTEEKNQDKSFSDDISQNKELEITEDEVSDGSVQGQMKKDPTRQGDLKGDVKKQEAATKGMNGKGKTDDIDAHFRNKEKYNADKKDKKTNTDFHDDESLDSKEGEAKTQDFVDQQKNKDSGEGNVHAFKTNKVSAQLKGKITPEKEEPVNLESGSIESFIKINDQKVEARFEDIMEEELYLQVDKGIAQENQKVNFSISFSYGAEEVRLKGAGSIGEVEKEDNFDFIIIDITKVDITELKKFLALYGKRQESINQFLSLAKGA